MFVTCDTDGDAADRVGRWVTVYRIATAPGSWGITDLWFDTPNDGWAVIDGKVLHYDGNTWSLFHNLASGYPDWHFRLEAVAAAGPRDVWAGGLVETGTVGDYPHLFHYDGSGWKRVDIEGQQEILDIYLDGDDWGWFGGDRSVFSYDGGGFTPSTLGYRAWSFSFRDREHGFCTAYTDAGFAVYRWLGINWIAQTLVFDPNRTYLTGVSAAGPDDAWVVGGATRPGSYTIGIAHRFDGDKWTSTPCPPPPMGVCSFAADGTGWLFASQPETKAWHFDGREFRSYPLPSDGLYINAAWTNGPRDVWAATAPESGYAYILHCAGVD